MSALLQFRGVVDSRPVPETAQTQTQQSWEPLIYAYVTLIQHDACEKKDSSSIAGMTVDDHCPLKNRTDGGLASCPVKLRERSGEMAEQSNHKRKISEHKRSPAMLEMQSMSTWTRQSRCARNPRRTNICHSDLCIRICLAGEEFCVVHS